MVNIKLIFLVMHKLPVILETKAKTNILRGDKPMLFLRAKVVHRSEIAKTYDGKDKLIRTIGSTKIYVHVG